MALALRRRAAPAVVSSGSLVVGGGDANRLRRAITAAGARITSGNTQSYQLLAGQRSWQTRAFYYYDRLGEINYASQFYSRMLSPLRLYVAKRDQTGKLEEVTNEPQVLDALERIQDPGGGRSQLQAEYGRLRFLTGEAILFVTLNPDTKLEQWEMLSSSEVRRVGSRQWQRITLPGDLASEYRDPADDDYQTIPDEQQALGYRLWRRHPRFSGEADCSMRAVLDLCDELLTLSQAVRARARSRLMGPGILFISELIAGKVANATIGHDEDPLQDPFMRSLVQAITTAISDEGSPEAVSPIVIRVPGTEQSLDVSKLIYHLQLFDPAQVYPETGLRRECIDRIAIGLDMPPEILTGTGDVNHWGAWQIDEQTWKGHGEPVAQELCADLTSAYLRPTLKRDNVPGWQDYVIAYDDSKVVNHPNQVGDAKDLYDRGQLGPETLRKVAGFTEDDKPTQDEYERWVGVQVKDAGLATGDGVTPAPTHVVVPGAGGGPAAPPPVANPGENPEEAPKGPPPPPPAEPPKEPVTGAGRNGHGPRAGSTLAAKIVGASDAMVLRAREVAGNRVRSAARRDHDVQALIREVRASDVCAFLGPAKVATLVDRSDAAALVDGSRPLVEDVLRCVGVTDPETLGAVAGQVEKHAARTLYEIESFRLPPQFHGYVEGLVGR